MRCQPRAKITSRIMGFIRGIQLLIQPQTRSMLARCSIREHERCAYTAASLVLYRALSGDRNLDRTVTGTDENYNIDGTALTPPLTQLPQSYFAFKPNMLSPGGGNGNVTAITDPFGKCVRLFDRTISCEPNTQGIIPRSILWSTAGGTYQRHDASCHADRILDQKLVPSYGRSS